MPLPHSKKVPVTFHVGIYPYRGLAAIFNSTTKETKEIKTWDVFDPSMIDRMYEKIKTQINNNGKLGCACINLNLHSENEYYKKFIDQGLKAGFSNVSIINETTGRYFYSIFQSGFKPKNDGDLIWIIRCEICEIWQLQNGKANFIKIVFDIKYSNENELIKIKMDSEIFEDPNFILYLVNFPLDETLTKNVFPEAKVFGFTEDIDHHKIALIKARIMAGDSEVDELDANSVLDYPIILKTKKTEIMKIREFTAMPFKKLINSEDIVSVDELIMISFQQRSKTIPIPKSNSPKSDDIYFEIELDALIKLGSHSHIITFMGWTLYHDIPALVTELATKNLLQFVNSFLGETLPTKTIISILWQISQALEHVASLMMVHRDVACRNILLTENNVAKLADFGLCCHCDESFIYHATIHKRLPLSIEALVNRIFSEKSDVWSFGILCYEIFSYGSVPYATMTNEEMLEFLKAGERLEKPRYNPDIIYSLMLDCWKMDPKDRPKFQEIGNNLRTLLENETASYGYLTLDNEG